MPANLSELNRYIYLTRSFILYMDEVLISRSPAIDKWLAKAIREQLVAILRNLRDERRMVREIKSPEESSQPGQAQSCA
ncbi:hypothetical protein HA51_24190 [Pantoea rwandensis]|uniref:Uncharacterized protein n=1 Tax=Pantoea rwandensis TaxID=1076550 RepID=A0A1X1CP64_9GAMM|nr:hypothetical protein HA51_24190 [Pantoea rwandensis]